MKHVDIPKSRYGWRDTTYAELEAAAKEGKAVLIPLDGRAVASVWATLASRANRNGWSIHRQLADSRDALIMWLTPFEKKKPPEIATRKGT